MLCLYCGERVPSNASRALGNFCSGAHRSAYYQRSLRRAGLSRSLGGFRSLSVTAEVHGAEAARPSIYSSSSLRLLGAWHLSATRKVRIPSPKGAVIAKLGATAPERAKVASVVSHPVRTGRYLVPGTWEGSLWRLAGASVQSRGYAGLALQEAIPKVRIWDHSGFAKAPKAGGDRMLDGGDELLLCARGLKLDRERIVIPAFHSLPSTSRGGVERIQRSAGTVLRRDFLPASPFSPAGLQRPEANKYLTLSVSRPAAVAIRELRTGEARRSNHKGMRVPGFDFSPAPLTALGMKPERPNAGRPTRPKSYEVKALHLDSAYKTAFSNGAGPRQTGAALVTLSTTARLVAPHLAIPTRSDSLSSEHPEERLLARALSHPVIIGLHLSFGTGHATVQPASDRFAVYCPLPAILEGLVPNERAGSLRFAGGIKFLSSTMDVAITGVVLLACGERALRVLPDMVPAPQPVWGVIARRVTTAVPGTIGYARFLDLAGEQPRLPIPLPLLDGVSVTDSKERRFTFQRVIGEVAFHGRTALQQAGASINEIRQIPEGGAEPLIPEGVNDVRLPVGIPSVVTDSKMAGFAGEAPDLAVPVEGHLALGEVSFRGWLAGSHRQVLHPRSDPEEPMPSLAGFAAIVPPELSWSTVTELRERIFNPLIKKSPESYYYPLESKMLSLRPSAGTVPVPLDFRWQRVRKLWDRAARWKAVRHPVYLPIVTEETAISGRTSLLEAMAEGSRLDDAGPSRSGT